MAWDESFQNERMTTMRLLEASKLQAKLASWIACDEQIVVFVVAP